MRSSPKVVPFTSAAVLAAFVLKFRVLLFFCPFTSDNSAQKPFTGSATQSVFCAHTNLQHKKKSSILWGFWPVFAVLATIFLLVSCDPPKSSPPPKLSFRQSAVVTSRAHQTYTNELFVNGKPAKGNVSYRITDPADFASKNIKIDENTGKLTFQEPVKVTVEAKHTQGSSATYTLTITNHFSGRFSHRSVVVGSDLYVMEGCDAGGASYPNDVWKSADGEQFWVKVTTEKIPERTNYDSVVKGLGIYVVGGADNGINNFNDDIEAHRRRGYVDKRTE